MSVYIWKSSCKMCENGALLEFLIRKNWHFHALRNAALALDKFLTDWGKRSKSTIERIVWRLTLILVERAIDGRFHLQRAHIASLLGPYHFFGRGLPPRSRRTYMDTIPDENSRLIWSTSNSIKRLKCRSLSLLVFFLLHSLLNKTDSALYPFNFNPLPRHHAPLSKIPRYQCVCLSGPSPC